MAVREPAVAGTFYPADQDTLRRFCAERFSSVPVSHAKAVMLPHAGYVYSGDTACLVLDKISVPETVFLIGPNHRGIGSDFALQRAGSWMTPLGDVPLDEELSGQILAHCQGIEEDIEAHANEHSLEVEIPFLQTKNPLLKIVPLLIGTLNLQKAKDIALQLGEVLSQSAKKILVVASSDMNHYEEDSLTRRKDQYALRAIQNLDPEALAKAVIDHQISMCGFLPVYMLLVMHRLLTIRHATLVDYRTSADASGDSERVVGYAGFIFE